MKRAKRDHPVMAMPSVKQSPLVDLPTLQPERCCKSGRNPKQVKLDRRSRWRADITRQTLIPRHPIACSLLSGEWSTGLRGEESNDRLGGDRHRLCTKQMHPGASGLTPTPVFPQERMAGRRKGCRHIWGRRRRSEDGPENSTHPTRFLGLISIPQT